MSQYGRAVGAAIPEQKFAEAVDLAHAAARQYDALKELESAYFLADGANSRLLYFGLYATKADLDATANGAREQFDAFSAITGATVDLERSVRWSTRLIRAKPKGSPPGAGSTRVCVMDSGETEARLDVCARPSDGYGSRCAIVSRMGWTFEHSADTPARAADIWSRYADVENWFAWSPGVERSRLDGAFEVGSTGESKFSGVDAMSFRIVRVELESVFATETELPGATLLFEHIIEKRGDGSRITHRAVLSGPSADAYVPVVQPLVEKNLAEGVTRLAGLAVSTSSA